MMPGIALGGIQQQQSCCCSTGVPVLPGHSSLQARSCPIAPSVSLRRSSLFSRAHGPSTAGARTVLQPGLRPVSTRASREPDRVSTLSADELDTSSHWDSSSSSSQQAPQRSTTTTTNAQDRPANTQPGSASPEAAAAAAASPLQSSSTRTNSSLGITSSSSSGQHQQGFGVTAAELRLLVQAGVDDSQADAAGSLVTILAQQLRHKQHHTHKHHTHTHKAAAASGDAAAAAASGGSGGSMGGSLGSVCTDPTAAAAAAGETITPSNGVAARSSTNGTAAAATVAELTPSSSSSGADLSLLPRALASALGSSLSSGLSGSASDVAARVSAFGTNSLAAAATSSFWQLLLEAASDSTLLLLMAAGAVSLSLAASTGKEAVDFIDGAAILASVAICVTVTAVTNYQKEAKFRQLNSLKENIPVRVVRGGVELTLSCFDLLVGDVLLVEAGDILPADGLLYAGGQIKVDESHLTGESDDVVKEPPSDKAAAAAGSNGSSSGSSGLSSCLCMSGSKVLEGFGRMLVLAVGPNSQQGMIQQMVLNGTQQQQQPGAAAGSSGSSSSGSSMLREATPLMSRLEDVAGAIGGVGLAAAAAVLAVNSGLYTFELLGAGLSPWTSDSLEAYLSFFITSMTLLVVAVPEGLPLAVTLALAFSVQRMLADNNLVRNLSSCETMAAATAICSDKTGTLTENNMAVVKLVVGGATFNVRPSATTATAAAAAATTAAAAAIAAGGSEASLQGSSGFGLLPGSSSSSSSTRSPTLRSTSSIAASTGTTSEEEGEGQGAQPLPTTTTAAAAAAAGASVWQSPTASQNGSSSSGSNGSSVTSISSAVASTSSGEGLSWPPAGSSDTLPPRRKQQQRSSSSSSVFRPDVLTMVSLSLDGEPLDPLGNSNTTQQQQQRQQQRRQQLPPAAAAAAVENGTVSDSNSDSELLLASTASYLGPAAAAGGGAAGGDGGEGVSDGSSSSRGRTPRLSRAVKQLLADSISLNSTASIRLVDTTAAAAAGSNGSNDGQQQQEGSPNGEALACAVSSSSRQLDRSGNRTECALLEFGGRLEGRLLPGCGSSEQASRVLQVFPFSSSRKRMSSLVASGAPLVAPGSGAVGQPARLYVKGAAELLLDSCRLQVSLDGSLAPLPPDQVSALKARCGRGGLRVLALAYKDMLLPPAQQQQQQQQGEPGAATTSSSSRGVDGRGGWQLLSGDDDQSDLVLIGLLALEDPVRAEVPGAIKDCQRAGIAVRMITGDNAATAAAIAASCGILTPTLAQQIEEQRLQAAAGGGSNGSSIHTNQQQLIGELRALLVGFTAEHNKDGSSNGGSSSSSSSSGGSSSEGVSGWLSGMLEGLGGGGGVVSGRADPHAGAALMNSVSPDPRLAVLEGPVFRALVLRPDGSTDLQAFAALWPHLRVMARCTPADKFTLVQAVKALRARGELMETIAMTGDGTNDAPALNAADVGFAMAAGTSIAKDASDILLLDNNFRSIVSAVKWGRNVYSSVTKFLQFQLTANVVALVTAAGGALALRSSPLSAVQMLWVNLIMDSLASLALATEAPSDSMLDQPPRVRDGPIITPTVAKSIVGQAALQLAVMAALLGPLGESLTHKATAAATADTAAVTDAAVAAVAAGGAAAAAVVSGVGVDVVGVGHERIEQYTLVFNSFVLMQLFNQVNSRKIHDEPDVLAGLGQQKLFLIILGLELGLQVAIVQAGGRAFSTVPLSATQWGVCVGFGGLTLLLRQALRALPTEPPATPPPTAGGGDSSSSGSSSSRPRWQQQGAVAAAVGSAAAAAVGSAVAAPVKGVRQLLQGAAAAAAGAGRSAAADSSRQSQQSLPRQHARR